MLTLLHILPFAFSLALQQYLLYTPSIELHVSMLCCCCVCRFYKRWKEEEQRQAHLQGFSIGEDQLQQDWAAVLALADQKRKSLEQIHVFALAHILRRPIVVYGVKVVKNYRGENLGFVNFEGIDPVIH